MEGCIYLGICGGGSDLFKNTRVPFSLIVDGVLPQLSSVTLWKESLAFAPAGVWLAVGWKIVAIAGNAFSNHPVAGSMVIVVFVPALLLVVVDRVGSLWVLNHLSGNGDSMVGLEGNTVFPPSVSLPHSFRM